MENMENNTEKNNIDNDDSIDLELSTMNSTEAFYNKIYNQAEILRNEHALASSYFQKLHHLITLPSILISGVAGILSFVSSSKMINDNDTKNNLEVSIGVISAISLILQSFSSTLGYSAKRESHRIASNSYNNLITSVEFEKKTLSDPDFIIDLEQKIKDIKSKCSFPMPEWIRAKFS